jgi:ligand-binding sensor domain-containing protein/signal transduction histidine kinase
MSRVYKNLIIFFLCFLSLVITNAQKSNMAFRHLTNENGLSQNNIFAILQDRQGYMWFATRDGLNRYDGNTFVVFKNNPNDPESLSDNFIWDIIEDNKGYLWIATHGGINKFDPVTERFTRYLHDPGNPNSISNGIQLCILQDSRGDLWFGGDFGGLNKFNPATQTFTHYRNDNEGEFVDRITDIVEDKQGDIWFVGNQGLHHVNPNTGYITRPRTTINHLKADHISIDETGNLWIVAWSPNALVKYNPLSGQFTEYRLETVIAQASCNLLDDGQNGFWLPSRQGLCHFDRETGHFEHLFRHDETNPNSLNDNSVVSIYQDRAGLLWLGTEFGGINILNFQQQQFGYHNHIPNTPNSFSAGSVTSIYEDSNGILWIGFFPRALDRVNRSTGQITHYIPAPGQVNTLGTGDNLSTIYKDAQGYVWLGGWNSGLDRLDERSGKFKHYRHNQLDSNSLISNDVLTIFEDRNGNLWIGQHGGLSRFNRATEKFTNYQHDPNDPASLGHIAIRAICQDHTGLLWLGTWGGVLSCFNEKTETFVNYLSNKLNPQRLNGGAIYTLHEDRNGTLWVGAMDGLYKYHRDNGTFTRFTENNGLPSCNVQAILDDNNGRLWISTKNGLSRFDPRTETFRNYDLSDGLQDNDFSESCCAYGHNGEMFFGGSKGYNAFFPMNIKDNSYVPPVVLTGFQLFNMPVPIGENSPLKKAINHADQITLRYDQQVFSFRFSALSYNSPWKNHYAFKLEGFDKDWRYTDAGNRTATYTRLSPGNYTFRVRASNNDGVWNEKGTSVKITIIPPWWGTWWFRSIIVLVVLALAYSVHLLRVISIKKYNRKLEQEVAERTEQLDVANEELSATNEELETTNESLITVNKELEVANKELEVANKELEAFSYSVSHDLRAPLRHIEGFSQILSDNYQNKIDDQGKSYLQRIQGSALRMSQLIEDMLSLSRISRSEMRIQDVNLGTIAKEIADNLRESQPGRSVNFSICDELPVRGDGRLLRIVLENLMGNAWKYTSRHQSANIEVGLKKQDNTTIYYVRDDGAGFDMNFAKKLFGVFQRLHTADEFPGTGIGLATVQRIIHRHGGKVWAESEVEKGATFYFTIA